MLTQQAPQLSTQLQKNYDSLDSEDAFFAQENPNVVETVNADQDMASDSSNSNVEQRIEDEELELLRPLSDFAAASVVVPASAYSVSEDMFSGLFLEPDDDRLVAARDE